MTERYNEEEKALIPEIVMNLKETFNEIIAIIGFKTPNYPIEFSAL